VKLMKILMISTNKVQSLRPVFPRGMALVASHLKQAGHEVESLDLCFETEDKAVVFHAIKRLFPEIIGISVRNIDTQNFLEPDFHPPFLRQVVSWCREANPNATVLLGGAGFSHAPKQLMRYTGADFGIVGYGERSAVDLLQKISRNTDYTKIEGLVYFDDKGKLVCNAPSFFPEVKTLRSHLRNFYDKRYYSFEFMTPNSHAQCLETVHSKRGCVLRCIYCSNHKVEGHKVITKSPELVVDEIEEVLAQSETPGFEFTDGVFNIPLEHAITVCKEMRHRGLNMPWQCMLSAGAVTEELLDLMKETGCSKVEFGTDSCSDEILLNLGKNYTKADVERAHHLVDERGIDIMHCIFLGSPGDNARTIHETLDVMDALVPDDPESHHQVYFCLGLRIWDGTLLHDIALREGLVSGESDLLFPHFYISKDLSENSGLLDEIEQRIVPNNKWYLWWGLPNYSLKERIQLVSSEYEKMHKVYYQAHESSIPDNEVV